MSNFLLHLAECGKALYCIECCVSEGERFVLKSADGLVHKLIDVSLARLHIAREKSRKYIKSTQSWHLMFLSK